MENIPENTNSLEFVGFIFISDKDCPVIGDHGEDVFKNVDSDFGDEYFYSSELSEIETSIAEVYKQKDDVICTPKKVFEELAKSAKVPVEELFFPNEKYIKRIVIDNSDLLYFYRFGTFFAYKSEKGNKILVQVNHTDDSSSENDLGLEVTPFKFEEYEAPIGALNNTHFVVYKGMKK